jgi:hypothetical protein
MSGFLYYLPGETAAELIVPKKWLSARERHGLAETLADVRDPKQFVASDVLRGGPDGTSGVIVAARRSDGFEPTGLGYFRDKQTWAPTFGSAWIGYAELPRPEWLMRVGDSRSGIPSLDSFERRWLIPVARRPGTNGKEIGDSLPTQTIFDARLNVTRVVRLDARELWDLSGRVWDTFNGETDDPLTDDELQVIALKAWAWNYRVGPAEANAYANGGEAVIDSETTEKFYRALIHWEAVQRKKDETPTGSPSSTGSKEETPAGDPVVAN